MWMLPNKNIAIIRYVYWKNKRTLTNSTYNRNSAAELCWAKFVDVVSRVRKAGPNSQAKMPSTSSTSIIPALILKKFGTKDAKGNFKPVLICIPTIYINFYASEIYTYISYCILHVSAIRNYLFSLEHGFFFFLQHLSCQKGLNPNSKWRLVSASIWFTISLLKTLGSTLNLTTRILKRCSFHRCYRVSHCKVNKVIQLWQIEIWNFK